MYFLLFKIKKNCIFNFFLFKGNYIDIFLLHIIKSTLNRSEVRYEQLSTISGGLLTLDLSTETVSINFSVNLNVLF